MAFGAGALLSALSFELVLTAYQKAGFAPVAIGGMIGGAGFVILNQLLNQKGGFLRKPATTARYLRESKRAQVEELLGALSRVDLLRALPPEDIQAIVAHVEPEACGPGTIIFRQGEEGDALYLIDEGAVDLLASDGTTADQGSPGQAGGPGSPDEASRRLVAHLGPGDSFGEMALLTGEPRTATAVAATDVELWRIPKDDFDELVAVSPDLFAALEELLARNLQATAERQVGHESEGQIWHNIARRYVEAHSVSPTATDVRRLGKEHGGSAAMGIFLGLLLDGIPESLVIGMSMIGSPTVSATLIVGLFLSNLPEAMSSAIGMKAQGASVMRILGMWTFLMLFIGAGAFAGNVLFQGAPAGVIAAFEAAAAGAMLTMIAETALPEAYEQGGWVSGLATLLGFLAAFLVKTLESH